jgi:sulfur relay (sulfurtransferase) DsrF/TusC family protein
VLVANNFSLVSQIEKVYQDDKLLKPPLFLQTEYSQFLDKDELFELKRSLSEFRLKQEIFEAIKMNKYDKNDFTFDSLSINFD